MSMLDSKLCECGYWHQHQSKHFWSQVETYVRHVANKEKSRQSDVFWLSWNATAVGRAHQEGRLYADSLPQEGNDGHSPTMMDRARAYIPVLGAPGTTTSGYDVSLFPYSPQVSLSSRAEPLRQTCTVDVIRQHHSMQVLSLNAALLSLAMLYAALTMSQSGTCNYRRSGWLRHRTLEDVALGKYRCQRCA